MKSINKFKELIKDAVREVLNEEMEKINPDSQNTTSKTLKEEKIDPKKYITGDPIMDLLNETKQTMTPEDIHNLAGNSSNPNPFTPPSSVGSIEQMLQGSQATTESQVVIDTVPDYSNFNFNL